MYLVPLHEPTSMHPDPTRWLVTALIDELETLAIECREAAAAHRDEVTTKHVRAAVRSLNQAADTCIEISQLIRQQYREPSRRS